MSQENSHKNRVLIYVDMRRRDYTTATYLKHELEKLDLEVKFASRYTVRWIYPYFRPHVIISSHCNMFEGPLLDQWARECEIVVAPVEGAVVEDKELFLSLTEDGKFHPGVRVNDFAPRMTRYYSWGERQKRWLLGEQVFQDNQVVVTGYPRFDIKYQGGIIDRKNLPIGFLSSFDRISVFDNRSVFELVDGQRPPKNYYFSNRNVEDRYWCAVAHIRLLFELLDRCKEQGRKVLIRPHPNESLRDYDYLKKTYPENVSFCTDPDMGRFLEQVSSLVVLNSTAIVDAVLHKVPVICVEELLRGRYQEHFDWQEVRKKYLDHLWRPKSDVELDELLGKAQRGELKCLPQQEPFDEFIQDVYNLPSDHTAAYLIAQDVLKTLGESKKEQKPRGTLAGLLLFLRILARLGRNLVDRETWRIDRDYHLMFREPPAEETFLSNYRGL
ncbi:hypothetical protein HOF92_02300 [bacterium]|jgi:surface carbohydrate biosynthesis protein|nr:hypothetical protein [bacterium]